MRDIKELRTAIENAIESEKDELIAIGRHIWQNPEPGYREFKTSKYLIDKLKALGLDVKEGLAMTGFRADIDTGKPGPTLAIMGELDSLIIPNLRRTRLQAQSTPADTTQARPPSLVRRLACSSQVSLKT